MPNITSAPLNLGGKKPVVKNPLSKEPVKTNPLGNLPSLSNDPLSKGKKPLESQPVNKNLNKKGKLFDDSDDDA